MSPRPTRRQIVQLQMFPYDLAIVLPYRLCIAAISGLSLPKPFPCRRTSLPNCVCSLSRAAMSPAAVSHAGSNMKPTCLCIKRTRLTSERVPLGKKEVRSQSPEIHLLVFSDVQVISHEQKRSKHVLHSSYRKRVRGKLLSSIAEQTRETSTETETPFRPAYHATGGRIAHCQRTPKNGPQIEYMSLRRRKDAAALPRIRYV